MTGIFICYQHPWIQIKPEAAEKYIRQYGFLNHPQALQRYDVRTVSGSFLLYVYRFHTVLGAKRITILLISDPVY